MGVTGAPAAADQGSGQGHPGRRAVLARVMLESENRTPAAWRTVMAGSAKEHRVVIVGAGFAGFHAARELSRLIGATTEIMVINSTDYFLYLPLMPQVIGGLVEPAHIRASLTRRLRRTRFVLGTVNHVDAKQKVVSWARPGGLVRPGRLRPADPDRGQREQAAADPGPGRLRARVPHHRRSHVPARPHHPPARAGLGRHGPGGASRRAAPSSWSARATPGPRSRRKAS